MEKYISNYWCFIDLKVGENNITSLYYYSGELINTANKNRNIDNLSSACRFRISNSMNDIIRLGFKQHKNISFRGDFYSISSENKVEVFQIVNRREYVKLQDFLEQLEEITFDIEVAELQKSAVCVFQEQHFIKIVVTKYKKKKIYPNQDIL